MKYVMFEHAGSGNHGCEAIVRTTVDMLGKNEYYLQTLNPDEDRHFGLSDSVHLIESKTDSVKLRSLHGTCMRIAAKLGDNKTFALQNSIRRHSALLKNGAVAISIGGDNYCYAGIIGSISDKLQAFSAKGIPFVLWGCSVSDQYLNEAVVDDLKKYSLITAREALTIENLRKVGITDTVVSCSDPAFTLQRQNTDWNSSVFQNHEVIGINISSFMEVYNSFPDATIRNFKVLIEYLLKHTENYIALIPHVMQEGNDDRIPQKLLADELNSDRILTLDENLNCMQLKDIIAKCKQFIGCRTHSTIAAYSTCVPTLVVGYSVKARGIAKDIFGDYNDLLVDVREFKTDHDLLDMYLRFSERENELRTRLQTVMPEYINRAYNARDAILRIRP